MPHESKRDREYIAESEGAGRMSLKDDPTMQQLFHPLLRAIGSEHATGFWEAIEKEPEGVLAWGVQSGYLLWVRTHPGVIPTRRQIALWMRKGKTGAS
jgi:hypothetical protein